MGINKFTKKKEKEKPLPPKPKPRPKLIEYGEATCPVCNETTKYPKHPHFEYFNFHCSECEHKLGACELPHNHPMTIYKVTRAK